jgi:hypothetical protein
MSKFCGLAGPSLCTSISKANITEDLEYIQGKRVLNAINSLSWHCVYQVFCLPLLWGQRVGGGGGFTLGLKIIRIRAYPPPISQPPAFDPESVYLLAMQSQFSPIQYTHSNMA